MQSEFVELTFRWDQGATQTPRLFVVDGNQLVYAGAMTQKISGGVSFNDEASDDETESHFETTLVSFLPFP